MRSEVYMNEIRNNDGIDSYSLGAEFADIEHLLAVDYERKELEEAYIITSKNYRLWFDKPEDKISQIGVSGPYSGKFKGVIGIGSTLRDVVKHIGNYKEEFDVYLLPEYPGICFELEDDPDIENDEWIELDTPIEHIYVFKD